MWSCSAFWGVGIYNGLVTARNAFKNAFAQIDVQLQRRFDLIPNLVETAKGYLSHERETLEAVIAARGAAHVRPGRGQGQPRRSGGDGRSWPQRRAMLNGALGRLLAVAEAYPDLKANQNMMQLTEELTSHREQGRLRAPGLQRLGDGLQQQARSVPVQRLSPACSTSRRPRCWRSRRTAGASARGAEGAVLIA